MPRNWLPLRLPCPQPPKPPKLRACHLPAPPWTERLLGFAVRRGVSDQVVAEMAFALPPEPHGRSASEREPCRCVRLCMMAGAGLVILIIVAVLLTAA